MYEEQCTEMMHNLLNLVNANIGQMFHMSTTLA